MLVFTFFHKSIFSGHYFGCPLIAWTFGGQTNKRSELCNSHTIVDITQVKATGLSSNKNIMWLFCSWTLKTIKAQYPIWLGLDPKWISFLQIKETISNQGWKIHFHFFSKSPQLFAQKGPISDLALFSTETDSLSLFVEFPPIVLANTSKYSYFPKQILFKFTWSKHGLQCRIILQCISIRSKNFSNKK